MDENQDTVNQLFAKLESLRKRQNEFSKEMDELSAEMYRLKKAQPIEPDTESAVINAGAPPPLNSSTAEPALPSPIAQSHPAQPVIEQARYTVPDTNNPLGIKADIEKFIGENLINKIGIAITVIGVAIGAKYSIEHQLISPLARIVLGYLMGLGLLGVGLKLKKDYANYSAVLVSGAMAILFFMTYAAYSFYDLMPQATAFVLMVVFTACTVFAAMNYDRQVIAHIGLVGAYAVPFLLSEGSGKVVILFSYTAIINTGILTIAVKKYWKPLYYSSFTLTWLIFFAWYDSKYQASEHFALALTFLSVFFAIFYSIFLVYKLIQKEKFGKEDIILLLANSFIFYGAGYSILSSYAQTEHLPGAFTLCNAAVHFVVSMVIYRQKLADRNLFYLVAGLVLVFITIAIPVQLDGNWVTLLWAGEAALLFAIGRGRAVPVYEKLSYPLMFLAFFSIVHDWLTLYNVYMPEEAATRLTPIFNINFLTSVFFIASFVLINLLHNSKKYSQARFADHSLNAIIRFTVPAILLIVLYYAFFVEISTYWDQLYADSAIKGAGSGKELAQIYHNEDLQRFKIMWELVYSLLFFSVLSVVNTVKLKNRDLALVNLGLNALVMAIFLFVGVYVLGTLKDSYLRHALPEYYISSGFNIGIRYILFAFAGLMLLASNRYIRQEFLKPISGGLSVAFDAFLYITILWVGSSELIVWMDIMESTQSTKLGLSILWGVYALLLIVIGIWKTKKHLRIGAMALFGVTLLKLFFYDISHLDTVSKTIVLVSLGVLLLIISFLYNKYKNTISGESDKVD